MASLFVKCWPVGPHWVPEEAGARRYILEMDEYEFANLRWLMDQVYQGKTGSFNTGDWAGQIRHALVEGAPSPQEPLGRR